MTENELAKIIVDAAFQIHKGMGPGLRFPPKAKIGNCEGDFFLFILFSQKQTCSPLADCPFTFSLGNREQQK